MNATEIITELLHDPRAFKARQVIKMLYLEPIGLCDNERLTTSMVISSIWKASSYETDNTSNNPRRTKRFNYVAIGRGDTQASKVVDLRDAVLVEDTLI